jgi:hypothetical protein
MNTSLNLAGHCPACSRRGLLRAGLGLTATTLALGVPLAHTALAAPSLAADAQDPLPSFLPTPPPVPIPEIDAFNHHNVPAGPYAEPSQIFNFNGIVGAAVLAGTGVDQSGQLVRFGGPGTDLRFMDGEYVTADGTHHQGAFLRI